MKKLTWLLPLFLAIQVQAQKLSKTEQKIVSQIEKNYQETLSLLEETVNINSGTFNMEGVREVGKVFEREFAKIGFQHRCPFPRRDD